MTQRWKNPSYSPYARIRELGVSTATGKYTLFLVCREDCMGAAIAEILGVAEELRISVRQGEPVMQADFMEAAPMARLMHGFAQRGLLSEAEYTQVKTLLGEAGKDLHWEEEAANWRGTDI